VLLCHMEVPRVASEPAPHLGRRGSGVFRRSSPRLVARCEGDDSTPMSLNLSLDLGDEGCRVNSSDGDISTREGSACDTSESSPSELPPLDELPWELAQSRILDHPSPSSCASSHKVAPSRSLAEDAVTARRALRQMICAEAEVLLQPASSAEDHADACKAVRRQLGADATRARYLIDGVEYWYEKQQQHQQVAPSCNSALSQASAGQSFASALVETVEACLGTRCGGVTDASGSDKNAHPSSSEREPLDGLVHLVMLLLTQIGFAMNHEACGGQEMALCGGERHITHELARRGEGCWELRAMFCAHGFSQFLSGGEPMDCSTTSSVHRGFTVTLALAAHACSRLFVSVGDAFEESVVFTADGIPNEARQREPTTTAAKLMQPAATPSKARPEGHGGREGSHAASAQCAWLWPSGAWMLAAWDLSCSGLSAACAVEAESADAQEVPGSEIAVIWA